MLLALGFKLLALKNPSGKRRDFFHIHENRAAHQKQRRAGHRDIGGGRHDVFRAAGQAVARLLRLEDADLPVLHAGGGRRVAQHPVFHDAVLWRSGPDLYDVCKHASHQEYHLGPSDPQPDDERLLCDHDAVVLHNQHSGVSEKDSV